jgi:hypothetical protein
MRFFSPFFWICLVTFSLNQGIEKAGIHIPYVHAYLDDLLTAGIVMGFALFVQQQFTYKKVNYIFSSWHSVVFVVWYALLFEVVFPSYDARHHADLLDVAAYALGAVGFHFWGNKAVKRKLVIGGSIKKLIQ